MKSSTTLLISSMIIFSCLLVACKQTATPQLPAISTPTEQIAKLQISAPAPNPEPSPTTTTANVIQTTPIANIPQGSTTQPSSSGELCDNDYFPSDDGATWEFSGNNSKKGDYRRTDTVTDSRDDGFTILTKLKDVSYTQEFTCTEAGLINLEAGLQDLSAIFQGISGTVTLHRERNSGITFPKEIEPGDTWQQFLDWKAISPTLTATGSFTYHYTAMGLEVVTVPAGSYDAMRINVTIDVEVNTPSTSTWTYTNSLWLVKDIGVVKSEGSNDLRGAEFTDTIELESYDSP